MNKLEIYNWINSVCLNEGKFTSGSSRILRNKPEIMEEIKKQYNIDSNDPSELIYRVLNPNIENKCEICGKPTSFVKFYYGYKKTCSSECAHKLSALNNNHKNQTPVKRKEVSEEEKKKRSDAYKKRCIEKWGVDNPMKVPEIREKLKRNNLEKYGVDNPAKLESSTEKMKKTNLEKYGVEFGSQTERAKILLSKGRTDDMIKRMFSNSRLGNIIPLFTAEEYKGVKDKEENNIFYKFRCSKCGYEFEDHLNNGNIPTCRVCHPINTAQGKGTSEEEKEFIKYIESLYNGLIIRNDRSTLENKELDLYLPNNHIAFEFNGMYWHSEKNGKDRLYHLNKSIECQKKGVRLIHIFEDEWILKRNKIESLIKSSLGIYNKKIGARKCDVREIETPEAKNFLNENHLQDYSNSTVKIGLFYKNELVSVLTFSKPRFEKNKYDWEISRFANKLNYSIMGGFSKMLKYFREHYPGSIVTYSDRSKFTGNIYRNNGFMELLPTQPGYFYYKGHTRYNRLQFQKKDLIKKYPEYSNLTESEIMNILNYNKIWDCGNWKFYLN